MQDLSQVKLSKLSCEDLISLLGQVNELKMAIDSSAPILRENAITGKVLMYCDLNELKSVSISLSLCIASSSIIKFVTLHLGPSSELWQLGNIQASRDESS